MGTKDPLVLIEALESLLVARKWLEIGELQKVADQMVATRAALDLPVPGESTEG